MSNLLKVANLSCWFKSDDTDIQYSSRILENISFTIREGQTVALVGESGSGKTITALSILRLVEDIIDSKTTGSILFQDNEILTLTKDSLRSLRGNQISMIFQEPMTSLNPLYTIGSQIIEPLLLHRGMTRDEALQEAVSLLVRTGIPHPEERMKVYPHQLSGGQRQRVMIAMAIACRPKILIADEPTTALDVTVQTQILELLRSLQSEFGMAILLITHDLPMVRKFAGHVHIMKNGRIIEEGTAADIFTSPEQDYTKKLLEAIPSNAPETKPESRQILSMSNLQCHFTIKGKWKGPFKRETSTIKAVDNVSLSVLRGTTCGIVGESGSGKTTLGMAILRLAQSSGDILFNGQKLHLLKGKEMRPLRKEMQIVFQDPFSSLSPRLTVEEIVAEGLRVHFPKISAGERRTKVMQALEEVGLEGAMAVRYPHEFSGGQRQRIAIARSMILRPQLLILDEPTSALDMTIQSQIIQLLLKLQRKFSITYIFISHDLRVVRALADHIIVMQNGRIVEAGAAREIFSSPRQQYTKTLFEAALN